MIKYENGILYRNDKYVMSDIPLHRKCMEMFASQCWGKVLCLGLGLGLIAEAILSSKSYKALIKLDIVEYDTELIEFMKELKPELLGSYHPDIPPMVNIIQADAFTYEPAQYDRIFVDVVSGFDEENLKLNDFLLEKYKPHGGIVQSLYCMYKEMND